MKFSVELPVGAPDALVKCALEIEDERHQGLGDEAAAIKAEMAALVGPATVSVPRRRFGDRAHDALARG